MHQIFGKILSNQENVQFIYITISLFEKIIIFLSTRKLSYFQLTELECYNG
jgi:hypothetical protein